MTAAEQLLQKGRLEGKQEGRQEGRREEAEGIASKMLQEGADPAFIIKVTGLTAEDIERLQSLNSD